MEHHGPDKISTRVGPMTDTGGRKTLREISRELILTLTPEQGSALSKARTPDVAVDRMAMRPVQLAGRLAKRHPPYACAKTAGCAFRLRSLPGV